GERVLLRPGGGAMRPVVPSNASPVPARTRPDVRASYAPDSVRQAFAETGAPLAPATREEMESRFGYDFSTVQVHDGTGAAVAADELHTDAFAVGDDVVFARGRYAPATDRGRELLAHELAH